MIEDESFIRELRYMFEMQIVASVHLRDDLLDTIRAGHLGGDAS